MPVDLQEVELWGWQTIRLASGRISLTVAPQAGGRVVSLKLDDVEAFFTLPQLRGQSFDVASAEDVRERKRQLGLLHYGGYKTWLAPQDRWTDGLPFLDLDSGSYRVSVDKNSDVCSVRLTSPVCRETNMELTRTVSMSSEGRIRVEQAMTNRSSEAVTWGLWDVTQVGGPGLALLPVADESRHPDGVKAYANEGRSQEVKGEYVSVANGVATVRCHEKEPFKYGTDSTEGWIAALLHRSTEQSLAYVKFFEAIHGATYPHEATVEVYDSGTLPYFELEVHSPLRRLGPGETYAYAEDWIIDSVPNVGGAEALRAWVKDVMAGRA